MNELPKGRFAAAGLAGLAVAAVAALTLSRLTLGATSLQPVNTTRPAAVVSDDSSSASTESSSSESTEPRAFSVATISCAIGPS